MKGIYLFIPLLAAPALCMASDAKPGREEGYNMALLCLVGLILILLFVIGMLANTVRQLTFVVADRIRKERNAARTTTLLLLAIMLPALRSAAQTAAPSAASTEYIQGIQATDFYIIISVLALELMVIFALVIIMNVLLKIIRNKPELKAQAQAVLKKSWFWDKFNKAASLEKEKDILLDHDYDGIQELDNSLPPWWKYGFYITILVSIIYLYRYEIAHTGPSPEEEYTEEVQKGEEEKAAYLAHAANNVDESNVTRLTDPAALSDGKDLFVKNCSPCHLADGGGMVGPNLTDDYWLHGGSIKDVFKSIKYGWQDKGMKSWKDDFTPKQIQELASFVKSLEGTHPAAPKAPQGELYIEASAGGTPATDSTKSDSAKTGKVAVK